MRNPWLSLSLLLVTAEGSLAKAPPPTPIRPVETILHGTTVRESYRWLENLEDPEVRGWVEAQNQHTRSLLDADPARAAIADSVRKIELFEAPRLGARFWRGGRWFLGKRQPPLQQPWFVTRTSLDDETTERVVLDPNRIDPSGATAIDWTVPSLDGKLVAASLSKKGSELGTLHLFEVATGKQLPDAIPRVQVVGGGGSCAFTADGKGLYYTRYPHPGERPAPDVNFYEQVWFHKIGTPVEQDRYVIGKEFPRIAEIQLSSSEDGSFFLARVANGDGGEFAFWLGKPDASWVQLTRFENKVVAARFGRDGALYLLSREAAPRGKILRLPLATPDLAAARVVAPESDGAIEDFEVTSKHLFIVELDGGPNRVRLLSLDGKPEPTPALLPIPAVGGLVRGPEDEVVFWQVNALTPYTYYRWTAGKLVHTPTLDQKTNVDFSDCETLRGWAVSKDGTRVPYSMVRKKGTRLDGNNPTLLTGYGGYGISQNPAFRPGLRVFVDQGGVYMQANLRGGGEFGEAWHEAGKLLRKQNVFDDFVAVAKTLVAEKLTRPARLAVMGGSNGGLLVGAAITQHPELFRAAIISRGILDMIHFEQIANGQFNVTEFGTVADPAQFKVLYGYSPYHHVVDGTRYPSTLLETGTNDGRVAPSDSFKMAARLQAARPDALVLLRASDKSGHGMGSPLAERIAEAIDEWCFLFRELGVDYKPAPSGKAK